MSEKETLINFVEKIDSILEERKLKGKNSKENVGDEWSSNTYEFLKKYGHLTK